MRRAVLYLRVSTIDQMTANQERELRAEPHVPLHVADRPAPQCNRKVLANHAPCRSCSTSLATRRRCRAVATGIPSGTPVPGRLILRLSRPPCRATVAHSVRRQVSRKSPAAQVALPRTRRPPRLWPAQRPLIGRWVRQERPVDTWLSACRPPLVRLDATDPRRRSDLGLARPR